MVNYKLHYFPFPGRGHPIKLIFAQAGVKYEHRVITMEEWPKVKPTMPGHVIPTLEVDGKMLGETLAICQYLGEQFNMQPKDLFERAKLNELVLLGWDNFQHKLVGLRVSEGYENKKKQYEDFKVFINDTFKRFEDHLTHSKSGLLSEQPTWQDFSVYSFIRLADHFVNDPTLLKPYSHITSFIHKIQHLPNVKDTIEKEEKLPMAPFRATDWLTPEYKLHYFNFPGRGHPIRLIFAQAQVHYEQRLISFEDWPKIKPTMPGGVIPALEINGKMLGETLAICQYLGDKFGMQPTDMLERAQLNELVLLGWDNIASKLTAIRSAESAEKKKEHFEALKKFVQETLKRYDDHLSHSKSGLFSDHVSWYDFSIYTFVRMVDHWLDDSSFLKPYKHVTDFVHKVQHLPNVKDTIEKEEKTPMAPFKISDWMK